MEDRVVLSGLRVEGRHGASAEERARPQPFEVHVECPVDARASAGSDDLAATLDYRRLAEIARQVIGGPSRSLIETLADRIASRIVAECGVRWARVRVTKLPPPGLGAAAAIEVERGLTPVPRTTTMVELHVPDFGPLKDFYGRLGFHVVREEPPEERNGYLVLARGENVLRFWSGSPQVAEHAYFRRFPSGSPRGYAVEIVIVVDDLDRLYDVARGIGAVVDDLRLRPWAARDFRVADPFGFYLRFTEPPVDGPGSTPAGSTR